MKNFSPTNEIMLGAIMAVIAVVVLYVSFGMMGLIGLSLLGISLHGIKRATDSKDIKVK